MHAKSREKFTKMLNWLIKDEGITPTELARRINYPATTVYNWCQGVRFPKAESLEDIANYFNVLPSDLISDEIKSTTLTPLNVEIKYDDYFPMHFKTGLSAGIFSEPPEYQDLEENIVYVPIKFLPRKKRLAAFKVNGESMNNVIPHGSIAIIEDTYNNAIPIKNGDIIAVAWGNDMTLKRFYDDGDKIVLSPDSTLKSFTPIILDKSEYITIIGKLVWWSNPDDVVEQYYER